MLDNTENIILEIGLDLISCANSDEKTSLIPTIKKLRSELDSKYSIKVNPIRVRDNIKDLKEKEYRVLQNDEVLIKKDINSENKSFQIDHIVSNLKVLLI